MKAVEVDRKVSKVWSLLITVALWAGSADAAKALSFDGCSVDQIRKVQETVELVRRVYSYEALALVPAYGSKHHPLVDAYFDHDGSYSSADAAEIPTDLGSVVEAMENATYVCGPSATDHSACRNASAFVRSADDLRTFMCPGSWRRNAVSFAALLAHEASHEVLYTEDVYLGDTTKETSADLATVGSRVEREQHLADVRAYTQGEDWDGGTIDARAWGGFVAMLIGHHFDYLYESRAFRGTSPDDLERELTLLATGVDRHAELGVMHEFLAVSRSEHAEQEMFSHRAGLASYPGSDFRAARCVAQAMERESLHDPLGGRLADYLTFVGAQAPQCAFVSNALGWQDQGANIATSAAAYWRSQFAAKFVALAP